MRLATAVDLARAAQLFHALSDETRLGVLEMLRDGERCVCELQDELDAAQSRLSFHLRVLKDAGLVVDRREGRWSYYSIVPDGAAPGGVCGKPTDATGHCCDAKHESWDPITSDLYDAAETAGLPAEA